MGKRSNFKRRKQAKYFTPPEAIKPLLPHLEKSCTYIEPCVGEGHIVKVFDNMIDWPRCYHQSDYELDATIVNYMKWFPANSAQYFITNPPWTRQILHPIIDNLSKQLPTWLLFDADWMHTKQAIPYLTKCKKIVSIGRISWMQNGVSSLDNCCWYLFDINNKQDIKFYGRT